MVDKNVLKEMLSGDVVIACIGNELRGDDGVGPFVSRLIEPSGRVSVLDCGETPENYLGVISRLRPQKVIIIDAAWFGGYPGEVRVVKRDEITGGGPSTHDAILTLFSDFVEKQTGAETCFLAIQPGSMRVGEKISKSVEQSAREVAELINEITGVQE
jgi:hydrogenase 3 maturation protease